MDTSLFEKAMEADLATQKGAELFAAAAMQNARDFYNQFGWHPLVCHVLATRTVSEEQPIPEGTVGVLTLIAEQITGAASKDQFNLAVRLVVLQGRAVGVLLMSEAYHVAPTSVSEALEVLAVGSIKDHPRRREGITVSFEHIRMNGYWFGEIRDKRVGEFERGPDDFVAGGRFGDLLDKERFT